MLGGLKDRFPIAAFPDRTPRLDHPDGRGWQLAHSAQDGVGGRHHGVEVHVMMERHGVDVRVDPSTGQQGRQSGGETQTARNLGEIERFDAQPITRQGQASRIALGDGEGEHPVEAIHAGIAPGMECLEYDLGIAMGEEAVALAFEFFL